MGAEQLSGVLDIVMRQALGGKCFAVLTLLGIFKTNTISWWTGNLTKEMEEMANARKEKFKQQIEMECSAYYTSSRMIDDGIIGIFFAAPIQIFHEILHFLDPRDTRIIIGMCLSIIYTNEVRGGNLYGVSRM